MVNTKKAKKVIKPKKTVKPKLVSVKRRLPGGKTYTVKAYPAGTRIDPVRGYKYNRYRQTDGTIFHVKVN